MRETSDSSRGWLGNLGGEKKQPSLGNGARFQSFLSSAPNPNISSVNKMIMLESALNAKEHCPSEGASMV